jgi:hypothetical protein
MVLVLLLRVGSEVLHSIMGGLSLFCLYYSAQMTDSNMAWHLFIEALKWGGLAATMLYYKTRYLDP